MTLFWKFYFKPALKGKKFELFYKNEGAFLAHF